VGRRVPKSRRLRRSIEVRMNKTFEIISPEKCLVHHDIEACPISYWIKYLLSCELHFFFLAQIKEALTFPKHLLP